MSSQARLALVALAGATLVGCGDGTRPTRPEPPPDMARASTLSSDVAAALDDATQRAVAALTDPAAATELRARLSALNGAMLAHDANGALAALTVARASLDRYATSAALDDLPDRDAIARALDAADAALRTGY